PRLSWSTASRTASRTRTSTRSSRRPMPPSAGAARPGSTPKSRRGSLARGRLEAVEPVVRERLPGRDGSDEDVRARPRVEGIVDRGRTDTRCLRFGPAATEEVRAAREAERLGTSPRRPKGLQEILAFENPDRRRRDSSVHRRGAARELLAALAMAVPQRVGCLGHLEPHASAEAAALQRCHGTSLLEMGSRSASSGVYHRGMATNGKLTAKDYKTDQEVRWCPGCGDYAILAALQSFMPELDVPKERIVFISGIGCAARFPYYLETYGMHSIHGRAPAIATGLATSRPDLSVWVVTGDGDSLSIGGNHLIHALRRNVNIKILLFNNEIYGLTKGQYSPTSPIGKVTKSTPMGSLDWPFNPISLAIGAEATFVARAIDTDRAQLTEVLRA